MPKTGAWPAIIYRHSDGYPKGAGVDLRAFLKECNELRDSRLNDASYLAARYVVFLARQFSPADPKFSLDLLSVGVCLHDPSDIEYRYTVDCDDIGENGLPALKCTRAHSTEDVPIPE